MSVCSVQSGGLIEERHSSVALLNDERQKLAGQFKPGQCEDHVPPQASTFLVLASRMLPKPVCKTCRRLSVYMWAKIVVHWMRRFSKGVASMARNDNEKEEQTNV